MRVPWKVVNWGESELFPKITEGRLNWGVGWKISRGMDKILIQKFKVSITGGMKNNWGEVV